MTLDQVREMEVIKATNASLQAQVDALKKQVAPMQRNAPVAYVQVGCKQMTLFPTPTTPDGGIIQISGGGIKTGKAMLKGLIKRVQASKATIGLHNNKVNIKETQTMGTIMVVDPNTLPVSNNHGTRMRDMCFQRPQGGLPFTTENNPREHLKAIELRSGRNLEKANGKKHVVEEDEPQVFVDIASSSQELPKECEEVVIEVEELYVRPPPPPPLADALREMPQYAKFLKDIITNKRSWDSGATVPIPEVCNSIILNDLPAKLKDPGSFSIPCIVCTMSTINCLCDLGTSINLMPLTLFRALCGDQTVKSTSMVLQIADHSLKMPYGIMEDVLVKVDKFIFPVDFVILDYAVDKECPIILGRPFMNTGRALIDVHGGKLTLRIDEETVEFDMNRVMRNAIEEGDCMRIDLHISQVSFHSESVDDEYTEEDEPKPKSLIKSNGVTPPSSELPSNIEMKLLPSHLCYTFVGENETLLIIISNKLSKDQ
ncbi:uncharacterized protein LOC126668795 [Mercurialis annua]|uniref:uncharacterized protein LOC126668795 n=1 Tax=Mercurialis annua TaxID=3986 RepID=UPI00215F676E|nr:uncharacterized protein LOC126668795 [Mercurialis annua]